MREHGHLTERYGSDNLVCDTCGQPVTEFVADGPEGCEHIGSSWPCLHDGVAESVPLSRLSPDPITVSGGPGPALTASGGIMAPMSATYDFTISRASALAVNDYTVFAEEWST